MLILAVLACSGGDDGTDKELGRDTDDSDREEEVGVGLGHAVVCLGTDTPPPDTGPQVDSGLQEPASYRVTGRVLYDQGIGDEEFNLDGCGEWAPRRVFRIATEDGAEWWVGYASADQDRSNQTPTPSLQVAVDVTIDYAFPGLEFDGAAAVIRETESGRILFMIDTAQWLTTLPSDAHDGVLIQAGDAYGGRDVRQECDRQGVMLRLVGDETLELKGGEQGSLAVGGEALQVQALDAWSYAEDEVNEACDESNEKRSFIAWRE